MVDAMEGGNGEPMMAMLKSAIDNAISELGGPISKTILWHMNNKGIFSDPKRIDIEYFYANLKELIGPGAEMIIDDAVSILGKQYRGVPKFERGMPPIKKLKTMIETAGSATTA